MEPKGKILFEDCGIKEDMFPCLGICCSKFDVVFKDNYTKLCPYYRISTSLPYGPNLRTATIIECVRLGYGRRITE